MPLAITATTKKNSITPNWKTKKMHRVHRRRQHLATVIWLGHHTKIPNTNDKLSATFGKFVTQLIIAVHWLIFDVLSISLLHRQGLLSLSSQMPVKPPLPISVGPINIPTSPLAHHNYTWAHQSPVRVKSLTHFLDRI